MAQELELALVQVPALNQVPIPRPGQVQVLEAPVRVPRQVHLPVPTLGLELVQDQVAIKELTPDPALDTVRDMAKALAGAVALATGRDMVRAVAMDQDMAVGVAINEKINK